MKISFLKPSKIQKSLKILKLVKIYQNFVKKMFLLLKCQKLLTFLVKKKIIFFSMLSYGITLLCDTLGT